jgi:ABC-type transporter Mla subunit MlaD
VGTRLEFIFRMTEKTPTVDTSLEALSEALNRASSDLRAAVPAIEQARADIASRNTSVSRAVVHDVERVIDHLRQADECLRAVVKDLAQE